MKKLFFALVCVAALYSFTPWETIKGNGNIKKQNREVSGFTGVAVSGNMNVELAYGNSNTITVEADDNLLPYIETVVKDNILVIKAKQNVNLKSGGKITIVASATRLTDLKLSGSGNIGGEGNFSNDGTTNISLSGSGNITLSPGSFGEARLNISGSGNINLKSGNAESIEAWISGSGNIDCSSFAVKSVKASISGSGNIKVNAEKSIDGQVSGSGNIYYKGAATQLNVKTLGSGKIRKMS